LPFKTVVDELDLFHLLSPTFKQIEEKYDIVLGTTAEDEEQAPPDQLGCPYCGQVDSPQNMLDERKVNSLLKVLQVVSSTTIGPACFH
jgi:hypothetical protein